MHRQHVLSSVRKEQLLIQKLFHAARRRKRWIWGVHRVSSHTDLETKWAAYIGDH